MDLERAGHVIVETRRDGLRTAQWRDVIFTIEALQRSTKTIIECAIESN